MTKVRAQVGNEERQFYKSQGETSAFSIFKLKATTRENMSKLIMSWKEHLTYAFFDIFQGGVHAVFP